MSTPPQPSQSPYPPQPGQPQSYAASAAQPPHAPYGHPAQAVNQQGPPSLVVPVIAGARIYEFKGGAGEWFLIQLVACLIITLTLGICTPYALVLVERYRASNTYLYGQPLRFTGTGIGLFGLWIKWWVLIIITLGIYSFWVYPRVTRWQVENTTF